MIKKLVPNFLDTEYLDRKENDQLLVELLNSSVVDFDTLTDIEVKPMPKEVPREKYLQRYERDKWGGMTLVEYNCADAKKNAELWKAEYLDSLYNSSDELWIEFRKDRTKDDLEQCYKEFCENIDEFLYECDHPELCDPITHKLIGVYGDYVRQVEKNHDS